MAYRSRATAVMCRFEAKRTRLQTERRGSQWEWSADRSRFRPSPRGPLQSGSDATSAWQARPSWGHGGKASEPVGGFMGEAVRLTDEHCATMVPANYYTCNPSYP